MSNTTIKVANQSEDAQLSKPIDISNSRVQRIANLNTFPIYTIFRLTNDLIYKNPIVLRKKSIQLFVQCSKSGSLCLHSQVVLYVYIPKVVLYECKTCFFQV